MALESLIVVDRSGLPIASYPEELTTDTSVFSGLLTSLTSATEQLGIGSVETLKIGGKVYVVKSFNKVIIITILGKQSNVAKWYIDVLYKALGKILDLMYYEEGSVDDTVHNTFKNILSNFYEVYPLVEEAYEELEKVFKVAHRIFGKKTFELLNSVLTPFAKAIESNGELELEIMELDDPKRFAELLEKAAVFLRDNIKNML